MPPLKGEIKARIDKLAQRLAAHHYDAALIRHPLNIYYFSGTFVDGHLVITAKGKAYLLVFRVLSRAEEEACVEEVLSFRSLRKLSSFLRDLQVQSLALEEDRLPLKVYRNYQHLLCDFDLGDLSPLVRELRALKSPYERDCLRKAGLMLKEALEAFWPQVRPGLSELELAGLLEAELRRRGHPAYTRTYAFHQELAYGHLLSGPSGAFPSYLTTGQGGVGVPGFPQGPSFKLLEKNEPLLVDYAGWFEGYMVDQSRIFCVGELDPSLSTAFYKVKSLLEALEKKLYPGVSLGEIYAYAFAFAEEMGMAQELMAHGKEGVPFIGHGVGLEIDEWPPVAPNVHVPLQEGMVIALEPKLHFTGQGVIGLEDTFYITSSGPERLTVFPRQIISKSP